MGKVRQSNKETKKQPLLTPKEKKAAKKARKDEAAGIRPVTTRGTSRPDHAWPVACDRNARHSATS